MTDFVATFSYAMRRTLAPAILTLLAGTAMSAAQPAPAALPQILRPGVATQPVPAPGVNSEPPAAAPRPGGAPPAASPSTSAPNAARPVSTPPPSTPNATPPVPTPPVAQPPVAEPPVTEPSGTESHATLPAAPPPHALQPAPTQPSPAPPPAVVSAEQLAAEKLTGLLGHALVGADGSELGTIVDLLVDSQGRVRAVVVDVGGFLGVGDRKVAIAWSALRFAASDSGPVISTQIAPDRIKSWADYISGRPVAILGTPAPGR